MRYVVSLVCLGLILSCSAAWSQDDNSDDAEAKKALLRDALAHMQRMEMRLATGGEGVELLDRPLLTYGDSARLNSNGTMWAFGKQGRPLAILELYQPASGPENWVHAVTLTSSSTVTMKTPVASQWKPEKPQIAMSPLPDAPAPADKETARTRQMKELARRFTAHEFWDPDNSRFELRLLVQPVHRYSAEKQQIHDGAVFVLAHGTNPEVILLIEAAGNSLAESRWQYGLARLGSAEMHVELDTKEVWQQGRTPGVVGKPSDPYWLFVSPAEREE